LHRISNKFYVLSELGDTRPEELEGLYMRQISLNEGDTGIWAKAIKAIVEQLVRSFFDGLYLYTLKPGQML
jgi:hypothetical protein